LNVNRPQYGKTQAPHYDSVYLTQSEGEELQPPEFKPFGHVKTGTVNYVLRKVLGPGFTSYSLRNSVTKHLAATGRFTDEDRARKAGHVDVKQTREYEGERAYAANHRVEEMAAETFRHRQGQGAPRRSSQQQ
jgi:hypothetical protein